LKLRRETKTTTEIESERCGYVSERSETNPKTESRVRTTIDGFHTTELEVTEDLEKIGIVGGAAHVEVMSTKDCDVGDLFSFINGEIITSNIIRITKHRDSRGT
jgi:hypothetical protein